MAKKFHALFLFCSTLLIFLLSYFSNPRIMYTVSDPRYALLVSQQILQEGTIRLDRYHDDSRLKGDYRIVSSGGHTYYFYPLGTSVLSVPFVGVANRLGLDMLNYEHDIAVQRVIAAGVCAAAFLLIYGIGRFFVGPWTGLVISLTGVLGTPVISSAGVALWSFNYSLLFVLAGLWFVLRIEYRKPGEWEPYVMGVFLFTAYFSRPVAAIFIFLILIYLAVRDFRYFLKTAAVALACLSGFMMFNWLEWGTVLPNYYGMRLFHHTGTALKNLAGLLFSASRGLFVFSPVFAVVLGASLVLFKKMRPRLLCALCMLWPVVLTLILMDRVQWHGGHGFGPRLYTDVVPAFVLLNFMAARETLAFQNPMARRIMIGLFGVTAIFSIYVHTYQGLFNPLTAAWNQIVDIDKHPDVSFDWGVAQWRIDEASIAIWYGERNTENGKRRMK